MKNEFPTEALIGWQSWFNTKIYQKIAVPIYMRRTFNSVKGIFVNRVTEKFCNFVAFHMDGGGGGGGEFCHI